MGVEYQKRMEMTTVNLDAYIVNDHAYYLSIYKGKFFGSSDKGYAILYNDTGNETDALQSVKPHIYYGIINNTMENTGKHRAELDFSPQESVKHYLQSIVHAGLLDREEEKIYKRSIRILENMLTLQDEMIDLYNESHAHFEAIKARGYFTDEDLEKARRFPPVANLIQYKQFKDRYQHRTDFDVIYKYGKKPAFIQHATHLSPMILKRMASRLSGPVIKDSLDRLEKDADFHDKSEEEMKAIWATRSERSLEENLEESFATLRHPIPTNRDQYVQKRKKNQVKLHHNLLFWFLNVLVIIMIIGLIVKMYK